jgi:glycosyltransferase involved in cell wall biosynthesis
VVGGIYNKSYFKTLIALKNKLKYGERILFLNDIKHEYMFWLYTRAQMLVFTSIEETFGIPLLEAMGTGLPILAADAALGHEPNRFFNPSRVICGEAALYYNPFDMEDLINKILLLLKDKVQVLALNKAAMERVKKFVGEVVVKELIGVFNSFAKEKNHLE